MSNPLPQLILTFENETDRESAIKALGRLEVNSKTMGAFGVQKVDFPLVAKQVLHEGKS